MRLTAILSLLLHVVLAQTPEVPHKMNFAGITLTIRDDARREIQKDVDALTQYPKYFNVKVERAKTYFPIIEKIFAEERLPDDFKYLVIQESALIPDAVSVSNAVGFWQFKDFTAAEMGLRVDKEIDERMNIVSSTRAAAQYLKKNNTFFNNWLYALQAYQMGAGGVMRAVKDYESGTKHMEITSQTYWYVKKFLAHKIAFEGAVKGQGEVNVIAYENHSGKSLAAIAREVSVAEESLIEFNKWAKKGTVPGDKSYSVSIPVKGEAQPVYASVEMINTEHHKHNPHKKLEAKPALATQSDKKIINGLPTIKAQAGENAVALSKRAGVGLSFFLACNDLSISDPLLEGNYYYLKKKRAKAKAVSHTVKLLDETLWSVSQQYGVQLKKITRLNPGLPTSTLKPGTLVVLSGTSKSVSPEPAIAGVVEVETGEFFSWTVNPGASSFKPAEVSVVVTQPIEESGNDLVSDKVVEPTVVVQTIEENTAKVSEQQVEVSKTEPLPARHVVVTGETLYAIAKRYGVGVMDIVNWNQLKLEDGIKPGQELMMRAPIPAEAMVQSAQEAREGNFIVHEVKPADTLYGVARKYGVTIKDLMDWNQKKDFNVATGEKLKVQVK
ncbi:MAG: LysM peptidoglycan-binding domain-containing protein [Cyclobacteriaceae bacterium]|nr:LysM peptidoglycan-binding domain-containing protein [Cyclobacteriaceae bacterium]UYN86180.1 MAG: LysM peptidoglycan-binding domain-containing protein [Cyclobacteriaceae bacterium]